MSVKQIYLEPLWIMRKEFNDLLLNPPVGYEFISSNKKSSALKKLSRINLSYRLINTAGRYLPIHLIRAWLLSRTPIPGNAGFIYAVSHPSFQKRPWIIDMRAEQPHVMAGGEIPFDLFQGTIHRLFTSKYCRGIIYECHAGKRALIQRLKAPELETKIRVVPSGVPLRKFRKAFGNGDTIKLIFVNSTNINAAWNFDLKGGRILFETFRILKQDYENIELFVRSGVPEKIKQSYQKIPGLRIVDKPLSWEELEREFLAADIFVMPTHVTPSMVFLDAMSYQLPIITTDIWANPEYVRDGENGLLVHHAFAGNYTENDIVHFDSPAFQKALQTVDRGMVDDFAAAIRLLIENPELRMKMGISGRQLVEEKHSMEVWRSELKKVLDEALNGLPTVMKP